MYFVYMIKNADNKLYIGVSENPLERKNYHNENREAFFTKNQKTFNIVFLEEYDMLSEARKREIQLKKWRRDKKELLIDRYRKDLPTKNNKR